MEPKGCQSEARDLGNEAKRHRNGNQKGRKDHKEDPLRARVEKVMRMAYFWNVIETHFESESGNNP
jgi:hypothetical protein